MTTRNKVAIVCEYSSPERNSWRAVSQTSCGPYLRRILQNLIVNAIRYTDSGKVLVGVRKNGGSASIQVWDTGPGIPEDKQEVIFGEFQRLNASASAAEGMGLGLAIVERACAILKHPLRVQSRVGLGTAFIVDAPITESDQTRNTSLFPYAKITEMPSLGNLVVLLVENDLALQNALSITLEGWGADVLTATTATQARELLWDRGYFCGWLCPFGAMQEILAELAGWLGLKQFRLNDALDAALKNLKYLLLLGLIAVTIFVPNEIDTAAEVEPFKTAITVFFIREWYYVAPLGGRD